MYTHKCIHTSDIYTYMYTHFSLSFSHIYMYTICRFIHTHTFSLSPSLPLSLSFSLSPSHDIPNYSTLTTASSMATISEQEGQVRESGWHPAKPSPPSPMSPPSHASSAGCPIPVLRNPRGSNPAHTHEMIVNFFLGLKSFLVIEV